MDIKALIAKAGLSGEQADAAAKAFSSDSLVAAIEEDAMHRANAAFQADRDKMQANWDQANSEYLAMQTKVAELETRVGSTQAEKDAAARKLADAEKKVADLSSFDPNKFKAEILNEAQKGFNEFNVGARSFELDALDCVDEHKQLFGERISPKQLALDALAAKKSPTDYWNEKYNVTAKRAEIAKHAHDKEISDAQKKAVDDYIAGQANPATRSLTDSRNPFYVPATDPKAGVQPWDLKETPADESALMGELAKARVQ